MAFASVYSTTISWFGRSPLPLAAQQVLESRTTFNDRVVNLIYDQGGCQGKSTIARLAQLHHNALRLPPVGDHKQLLEAACEIAAIEEIKAGAVCDMRNHGSTSASLIAPSLTKHGTQHACQPTGHSQQFLLSFFLSSLFLSLSLPPPSWAPGLLFLLSSFIQRRWDPGWLAGRRAARPHSHPTSAPSASAGACFSTIDRRAVACPCAPISPLLTLCESVLV